MYEQGNGPIKTQQLDIPSTTSMLFSGGNVLWSIEKFEIYDRRVRIYEFVGISRSMVDFSVKDVGVMGTLFLS